MKNFYLLSAAFFMSAVAFGQVATRPMESFPPVSSKNFKQELNIKIAEMPSSEKGVVTTKDLNSVDFSRKNSKMKAASGFKVLYTRPTGTFYHGITYGEGWYQIPFLEVPSFTDVNFIPYATAQLSSVSWTVESSRGEIPLDQDEEGVATYSFFGQVFTPVLTGVSSEGATATYQMGEETKDGKGILETTRGFIPMSTADPAEGGVFAGYVDLDDYFGTGGMTIDGAYTVGVMNVFDKPLSPLYAGRMIAYAIPVNKGDIIPQGKELTLTLYKIDDEGKLTQEVIATATATAEDVSLAAENSDVYAIIFNFKEVVDGFEQNVPLILGDCGFVAQITGVDQVNAKFLLSSAMGLPGCSYTLLSNGKISTIGYSNEPETPQVCMHMVLDNSVFPNVYVAEGNRVVKIPAEGGLGVAQIGDDGKEYNDVDVYSSLPLESEDGEQPYVWLENVPDWLQYEADIQYYEDGGIIIYYFGAEEPHEKRAANVTIRTLAGVSTTIQVIQGEGSSISSTEVNSVKAINNNGNLELTYPAGVTSVEVMNAAGQVVGQYSLEGTSSIIPATDLAKGLYILKFNGENASTLKVMK